MSQNLGFTVPVDDHNAAESAPAQAVYRMMRTIELLADAPRGVAASEVADALSVDKHITARLLASLLSESYVVLDPDSDRFELSLRLIALAAGYADRIGFPGICQPILDELARTTGELVLLSVVERDQHVLAAYARARRRRRLVIVPALGTDVPPNSTASGRAWLASLPEERALKIASHDHLTSPTKTLPEELAKIRSDGYAIVIGEYTPDVNAVSAPIGQDRFGNVVGTVSVAAPASRMGIRQSEETAAAVVAASDQMAAVWPTDAAWRARLPRDAADVTKGEKPPGATPRRVR